MRKTSISENPFLQGTAPLPGFEDTMSLSGEDAASIFLRNWQEETHPLFTYERFFKRTKQTPEIVFSFMKKAFIHFVWELDWDEKKFLVIIDHLLTHENILSFDMIEKNSKLYDDKRIGRKQRKVRI